MTKGGVRIALKLMLIDSLTARIPETVVFMHSESILISSYNFINSELY
jgi:hypothetical protein